LGKKKDFGLVGSSWMYSAAGLTLLLLRGANPAELGEM